MFLDSILGLTGMLELEGKCLLFFFLFPSGVIFAPEYKCEPRETVLWQVGHWILMLEF